MSERRSNWKKHLLRSSVPLEYEAARILSKQGLNVSADYPYSRLDAGVETEFSVDIRGVKTIQLGEALTAFCSLDVLVECKYRERGTTWLFLPHPRGDTGSLSDVLRSIDLLSPKFIHGSRSRHPRLASCFAAAEVRSGDSNERGTEGTNRAVESHLRHGLRQLQYAMPAMIAHRARSVTVRQFEANLPFFVAPLLLTNADLMVANTDFGVASVQDAAAPEDLGKHVPFLIWSADLGPDFDCHCQRQFAALGRIAATRQMKDVEAHLRAVGESRSVLPSILAARIADDGKNATEFADFNDVLVVNIDAFAEVVEHLCASFEQMSQSLREEPVVRWTEDGRAILPGSH